MSANLCFMAWNEATGPAETPAFAARPAIDPGRVETAAGALRGAEKTLMLLGGAALMSLMGPSIAQGFQQQSFCWILSQNL